MSRIVRIKARHMEKHRILTKKNIVRGFRYLKNNGFRKLILRLKKGDHVFGIPYEKLSLIHI